jgi:surface carbohydrate biosynthesis protein
MTGSNVNPSTPTLIIPVENQVREFDAKLLLACVAAKRGFHSVIGSRLQIDFQIRRLPVGLYLAKGQTVRSAKMFRILRKLGHEITVWDEEALVHPPPEIFFTRKLSAEALKYVTHQFVWGQDNADLLRAFPELPSGTRIHITGNPRGDMLRSEMRPFFERDAEDLRKTYGDFILVNTNFNHVNAFFSGQNLLLAPIEAGVEPKFGRGARGMTPEYAIGLQIHKQALFEHFQRLIPELERTFPDLTIVVRPHPIEDHAIYHKIASQCQRVRVNNSGNVIPWLLAAKVLVHNSCTTGLEAYALGVPALSYRARIDEHYDYGFYRLPNLLSHECFDFEQVRASIEKILAGELGGAGGVERQELIDHYLAALDGPLACQRIVDVLEEVAAEVSERPLPSRLERLSGGFAAEWRHLSKRLQSLIPETVNRPEIHQHRFPDLSLDDVRTRASRLRDFLGHDAEFNLERLSSEIFQLSVRAE